MKMNDVQQQLHRQQLLQQDHNDTKKQQESLKFRHDVPNASRVWYFQRADNKLTN